VRTREPQIYILAISCIVIPALVLSFISLVQIYKERNLLREKIKQGVSAELQEIRSQVFRPYFEFEKQLHQDFQETPLSSKTLLERCQRYVEKDPKLLTFFILNATADWIYPQKLTQAHWIESPSANAPYRFPLLEVEQLECLEGPKEAFKRYIHLEDNSPEYWNNLARCAKKMGLTQRAIDFYYKALSSHPELQTSPLSLTLEFEILRLEEEVKKKDPEKIRQDWISFFERFVQLEPRLDPYFFQYLLEKVQAQFQRFSFSEKEKEFLKRVQLLHESHQVHQARQKRLQEIRGLISARFKETQVSGYLQETQKKEVYLSLKISTSEQPVLVLFLLDLNAEKLLEQLQAPLAYRNENAPAQMIRYEVTEKTPSFTSSLLGLSLDPLFPWIFLTAEIKDLESLYQMASTRTYTYIFAIFLATIAIVIGLTWIIFSARYHLRLANMKTDFVSKVTHELKTPLTSIRIFVETLQFNRFSEPADRDECLTVLAQESERLSRLIDNVLNFATLEKQTKKYHFQESSLETLVETVLHSFRSQVDPKDCSIQVEYQTLPSVWVDRDSIQDVLLNLLSNAYKYSKKGQANIQIRLTQTPDSVSVEISDQGIGIEEKYKKKIFDDFFRIDDQLTRRVDGCGLGLAIARSAARGNGGEVVLLSSELGKGSCFALILPKKRKS
jgi:signal transduction histidine kinase